MKTKCLNLWRRLKFAWAIAKGRNAFVTIFHEGIPDANLYLAAAMDAAEEYLKLKTDNKESLVARWNIIRHALITEESIFAQYKERDECCVSYDCNSEKDLDEFLNQEI